MISRISSFFIFTASLLASHTVLAVDSYRYTHVTIDTPWMIFLFLLVIILLPFILSAILYWYFANKKDEKAGENE